MIYYSCRVPCGVHITWIWSWKRHRPLKSLRTTGLSVSTSIRVFKYSSPDCIYNLVYYNIRCILYDRIQFSFIYVVFLYEAFRYDLSHSVLSFRPLFGSVFSHFLFLRAISFFDDITLQSTPVVFFFLLSRTDRPSFTVV